MLGLCVVTCSVEQPQAQPWSAPAAGPRMHASVQPCVYVLLVGYGARGLGFVEGAHTVQKEECGFLGL